ncbi:MAG: Mannose-1-phosphate guanylyltransferase [uncultured Thermomicrobiales bacterium]|uniref:mannose-1-phosphate guanylyltransferase n=1 Tax=uncultured Thermomicrobiales bacterium TaxID=1645740 RepID=A0A6J4V3T0_9BACT|nr:MAG: Mannose-1-phosphate guanylyltransferase [uncultured Thermomicrobiales bacterium]
MYVVIPAGGSGTRLWPLSRAAHPKFLHALTGDARSLIQTTIDRLAALAPPERTFIVTGGAHAAPIARQLPDLPGENILVEPAPRDSAPAIGLAAAIIHRRDPEAIMGSFASDHLVREEELFRETVRAAAAVARGGRLVTIGIAPTGPETGYGYIRQGEPLESGGPVQIEAYAVEAFKEKPGRAIAEEYVASGHYLWNASMFVWQTRVLLDEMARQLPELHAGLLRIAEDWDTPRREETLVEVWATLPKETIDVGIMEGAAAAGLVATVPGRFGWNDVGDWDTLASVLPPGDAGNVVLGGDAARHLAVDTQGSLIAPASGRVIATLGVQDLVVVDTEDAVLVMPRSRAQEVRRLVDALKAQERHGHL